MVNGGWYLPGKENERFEENYSKFIGTKYTIGCADGLGALIWIFRAYIEMGVMLSKFVAILERKGVTICSLFKVYMAPKEELERDRNYFIDVIKSREVNG